MRLNFSWFTGALAGLCLLPAAYACATHKNVVGWVEKGKIMPWGVVTKLKMDTGALTSSLQAENIEKFKKDGKNWVRFKVEIENEATGELESRKFERKILRRVKLSGAGGVDHRVAVLMKLCVGDTIYEEQFTLADRDRFNYPVLIGRRTIEHLGLIDVSRTFITEPRCDADSELLDHEELEARSEVGL